MAKTTYYLVSLSLLTGCAAENSKQSQNDNPYYHVETVDTKKGQLNKTTIGGPPTPPKGYERPIVNPNLTNNNDDNIMPEEDSANNSRIPSKK